MGWRDVTIKKRRTSWGVVLLVTLGWAAAAEAVEVMLSPAGADWKYRDIGSNEGTIWRSPAFDDGAWPSGPAQLGYGDGDEATVVSYGPNASNKYITTYFRRTIVVEDASAYSALQLDLLRDDGAVVYLNGTEVFRSNMPAGTIAYTTLASSAVGGSAESTWYSTSVSPVLADGPNVIAVEIHQSSGTSSDISFDLRLSGELAVPTLVAQGSVWRYLDNGTNQGVAWRPALFDDSSWASGAAQLGYGDGDETTVVSYGPSSANKYITTYFRHAFNVGDPAEHGPDLLLSVLRDDGVVVYLNGLEVLRNGLPGGVIGYDTLANQVIGFELEDRFIQTLVPASLLVAGTNVVAAEIHQASVTSSDISFDLSLTALPPVAPAVTRGPYLQSAAPTSLIVRWRTSLPTDSLVQCGPAPGDLPLSFSSPATATNHEVLVDGLMPNTTYYYSIGSTTQTLAGDDADHVFVTPPTPGTVQPVRVWVLGDSGTANNSQASVRDAYDAFAGATHTDLWIMLGDNAYIDGTDAQYQAAVFDMYPAMLRRSVLWPAIGNHDAHSADSPTESGVYFDIFTLPRNGESGGLASGTEAYYSFDHANIHFIVLDSDDSDRAPTGDMLAWLEDDLAATSQQWLIALWHHPPYSKGSHDSDNLFDSGGRMADMRQNALPILENAGVDLVLTGHSHSYERSYLIDGHYGASGTLLPSMVIDGGDGRFRGDGGYVKPSAMPAGHEGAVYVVAGSSGLISGGPLNHPAMYVSLNTLGSLVLDVDGGRLNATFIDSTGTAQDCFTLFKGIPTGLGDMNCDGALNLNDIEPFSAALLSKPLFAVPAGSQSADPRGTPCPVTSADLNADGLINGLDIDAMVEELLKGLCP